MTEAKEKNPHAVALGKRGKGVAKKISPRDSKKRSEWMTAYNLRRAKERNAAKRIPLTGDKE